MVLSWESTMYQRTVVRYSMSFKQQVIEELETGQFDSISQAQRHYGIRGSETIGRVAQKQFSTGSF